MPDKIKVLIVRFSSIGDIVLTTPVIRTIRNELPDAAIHFLCKAPYKSILESNPYLDKVHVLGEDWMECIKELKQESFTHLLDLHHNLRSLRLKWALKIPRKSFFKANVEKYRMVRFKKRNIPIQHVVKRYGETLTLLGVKLDSEKLDFFIPETAKKSASEFLTSQNFIHDNMLAAVLGAKFATKKWIKEHLLETLDLYQMPVILLGGKEDQPEAEWLSKRLKVPFVNAVGKTTLHESAALLEKCKLVLAHDTGLMHIAAALGKKICTIWGNTVPEFGMTPYLSEHQIVQKNEVSCRPCSKIGFNECPKGHFDCMQKITSSDVLEALAKLDESTTT